MKLLLLAVCFVMGNDVSAKPTKPVTLCGRQPECVRVLLCCGGVCGTRRGNGDPSSEPLTENKIDELNSTWTGHRIHRRSAMFAGWLKHKQHKIGLDKCCIKLYLRKGN